MEIDGVKWWPNPLRPLKDPEMLVDIIYRQGRRVYGVPARSRRWVPWPDGPCDMDIEFFRPSICKDS